MNKNLGTDCANSFSNGQSGSNPGPVWTAQVITLFPEAFPGVLAHSLAGKALKAGVWSLEPVDLRKFGAGRSKSVDDTPAGGGAGMVLRPDVVGAALEHSLIGKSDWPAVYLSPRGTPFTQETADAWARSEGVTFLCGRYEGLDERVIEHYGLEEVSIGDFVLSGGEIAAQALIDATTRLIPSVVGNQASLEAESFSMNGLLEYPQYTRPRVWKNRSIPDILVSGHHARIFEWRNEEAKRITKLRRPDLWREYCRQQGMSLGEESSE